MDINKKVCLNYNVPNANIDRISSLTDAILQHILSFIETKHAVQTCILSRRWKYVWTNIPCLNFKFEASQHLPANFTEERRNSSVNFMHQVLSRRCSSDIDKFTCYSRAAIDASHLRSFVDHALQCNVQIVEITYSDKVIPYRRHKISLDPFEIPHLMFTSKSLRVLKLTACGERSIILPMTLSFSKLKELHLKYVSLWDNTTERELISDCPNLEHLTLDWCNFGELQSLKITAPQLTHLKILRPLGADTYASPWKCNIIVSASKLSSFKYDSHLPLICSMGNPLNIGTVDINIWKFYKAKSKAYDEELAHRLIAMLQEFQHAQSVTLSLRAIKILSKVPGAVDHQSSPFCNLKNLRLNLKDSSFFRGLSYILQNSPQATTLLGSSFRFNMEDKAKW